MVGPYFRRVGALQTLKLLSQELSLPHTLCCPYKAARFGSANIREKESIVKLNHYRVK